MDDLSLRDEVVALLRGGNGHMRADEVFADVPFELWGKKARGAPHTLWQLLEHLRICQWDILEFSRNAKHVSPAFPDGYWPSRAAPEDEAAVKKSLKAFRADLKAMEKLVTDPATDLHAKIPWGEGQTIFREALLIGDHNAYHLGQFVLVRRLLGTPPGTRAGS